MRSFSEAISISAAGTTFSSVFDVCSEKMGQAEAALAIPTVTGTTPSLTVTPQFSNNGSDWQDAKDLADSAIVFTAITAAMAADTAVHKYIPRTASFMRFKYVVTGTSPVFTGKLLLAAR